MPKTQIGKVTHFFPKIGVAVVKLSAPLAVGARVSIEREGSAFEQTIDNMQIEHKQIEKERKRFEHMPRSANKALGEYRDGSTIPSRELLLSRHPLQASLTINN